MPHGYCYNWNSSLVYLHVISDSLIALSYFAIPFALIYFVRRRQDLPYQWIFLLFGVFIIACGSTHLMEIWNVWHADFWFSGLVKAFTAIASLITAGLLIRLVPAALKLPGREVLLWNEERFRRLVEGVKDYAIYMLDPDGLVVSWNPGAERIKGYTAREIIGKHFSSFYSSEDVELGAPARNLEAANREGTHESEGWRVRKDGSRFWASVLITALRDETGSLHGYTKITRDITERREAEEKIRVLTSNLAARADELESANKELEAFTYSVSHDLRAPLRAIDGFSKVLLEDCSSQLVGEGKRLLNVIISNVRKMSNLIDDLLAFSRLSRKELRPVRIDMGALLQEAFEEIRAQTQQQLPIRLAVDSLPPALGDRAMLRQVFVNLLSNGVKFSSKSPETIIQITGVKQDGFLVYSIRDNGVGFNPKYAHKLFGVFQRLHSVEEFEGTGVGLAIVKRIVQKHGGQVWADGSENAGATFHFSLPAEVTNES